MYVSFREHCRFVLSHFYNVQGNLWKKPAKLKIQWFTICLIRFFVYLYKTNCWKSASILWKCSAYAASIYIYLVILNKCIISSCILSASSKPSTLHPCHPPSTFSPTFFHSNCLILKRLRLFSLLVAKLLYNNALLNWLVG